MVIKDSFTAFATYNRGANERLYAACAELSDEARKRERGAVFGSIHATLNHLIVGDRIWMARFRSETVPSDRLDAILYEDFDDLRAARVGLDAGIVAFMEGVDDAFLDGTIRYRNNEGHDFVDPVRMLVAHFFNHQTHHRGQVHAMLTQTGAASPVLDLHRVVKPDP